MKPLLIFVLLIAAATSFAQTQVKIGQKITSADTVQVQIDVPSQNLPTQRTVYITVDQNNSGTIQFSVGDKVINNTFYAFPAGSKVPITIRKGTGLRYKASSASQSFVITQ